MTTKRTAEQIVDAIADAAHRLFVERSPSAVSIREIAALANVNLGLVHRYVGAKDDIISLVLRRHTEQARMASAGLNQADLMHRVADIVVTRPATGRLIAGMILDGLDVAELKGDFPLLDQLAENDQRLSAAMTYALALGWEVFGPFLLAAVEATPDPEELAAALSNAMEAMQAN